MNWDRLFVLLLVAVLLILLSARYRRGSEKPQSTQVRDGFFVFLAMTLGLSAFRALPEPFNTATRDLVLFALIAVLVFKLLSWPWQKRRAGALLLNLGPYSTSVVPAFFGFLFLIPFVLIWALGGDGPGHWRDWFLGALMLSASGFLILIGITGRQIRENGFLTVESFHPWEKIESYAWHGSTLSLHVKRPIPLFWAIPVYVSDKDLVEVKEIMERYVGTPESVGIAPSPQFGGRWSQP